MGVGEVRVAVDRLAIGLDRLVGAPEFVEEHGEIEVGDRIGGRVRDSPGCLECERKPGRGLCIPAGDRLGVRHPIERVIDLDGGEPLGVVGEHLGRRELLGVETPPPLRIVIP